MLPRAYSGSAPFPPEELLIRRVVSEREALEQLRVSLRALQHEPTSWFAPSRGAFLQRLDVLNDELSRAIAAIGSLVMQLEFDHAQVRQSFVAGV